MRAYLLMSLLVAMIVVQQGRSLTLPTPTPTHCEYAWDALIHEADSSLVDLVDEAAQAGCHFDFEKTFVNVRTVYTDIEDGIDITMIFDCL